MTSSELLTANDRCDRCGARAFVEVRVGTGVLMFCAHHFREFEVPLRSMSARINDDWLLLHSVS